MSSVKTYGKFAFVIFALIAIGLCFSFDSPIEIATESDLPQNVGRQIKIVGSFEFARNGMDYLVFGDTRLYVTPPNELSNAFESITVVGKLRKCNSDEAGYGYTYAIDGAVMIN